MTNKFNNILTAPIECFEDNVPEYYFPEQLNCWRFL